MEVLQHASQSRNFCYPLVAIICKTWENDLPWQSWMPSPRSSQVEANFLKGGFLHREPDLRGWTHRWVCLRLRKLQDASLRVPPTKTFGGSHAL